MINDERDETSHRSAPFLSRVRFGPGIIGVLIAIGCVTFLFYLTGHAYLAMATAGAGLLLVGVKAMEVIQLVKPEKKELIGRRCLVVKRIQKGNPGVVRVYTDDGRLDPELWSAESETRNPGRPEWRCYRDTKHRSLSQAITRARRLEVNVQV